MCGPNCSLIECECCVNLNQWTTFFNFLFLVLIFIFWEGDLLCTFAKCIVSFGLGIQCDKTIITTYKDNSKIYKAYF
jgi:hypothetical protein